MLSLFRTCTTELHCVGPAVYTNDHAPTSRQRKNWYKWTIDNVS